MLIDTNHESTFIYSRYRQSMTIDNSQLFFSLYIFVDCYRQLIWIFGCLFVNYSPEMHFFVFTRKLRCDLLLFLDQKLLSYICIDFNSDSIDIVRLIRLISRAFFMHDQARYIHFLHF